MKSKKEFILLAIVIVALSWYLFYRNTNKTHYQLPDIPQIAAKEITKLEISGVDASFTLNKKDNKWFIAPNDYPADADKVKNMLDVIQGFKLTALVSETESDHLYDLTEDKKISVKAWDDETLRFEFLMGRAAPSWNHTFVKLLNDIRVYHAKGNFRSEFEQDVEKLRDKTVLSFDQNEVEGMEIIKEKQSMVLSKKMIPSEIADQGKNKAIKTTWEDTEGDPADNSALDSLLSVLSNLKCEKYAENQEKDDFTHPIYTIKIKGFQEYSLSLFKKTDEDARGYPAKSSENDYPFLLSDSQGEEIIKGVDDILKKGDE